MKKPETVLTAFRLPKILSDQVDRVSNGNRSEYIRKAVTEKLEREKEQNVWHARNLFIPIRTVQTRHPALPALWGDIRTQSCYQRARIITGQPHLHVPQMPDGLQNKPDGRRPKHSILERSNNGKPTIQFRGRLGSSKPADYGSRRCDRNHRDKTWAEGEMMNNYREHYIIQLKRENQVLWGELSELERNSPAWKAVRKAIEANDTEISVMQDVINRSAPIAVEADYELITQ